MSDADLSAEDSKLITLARGATARVKTSYGAAARDDTGRTYLGADVALPDLNLTAVQLAVAQAVAAGATALEAVAIVGVQPELHRHDRRLLESLQHPNGGGLVVYLADGPTGTVTAVTVS